MRTRLQRESLPSGERFFTDGIYVRRMRLWPVAYNVRPMTVSDSTLKVTVRLFERPVLRSLGP